MAHQKTTTPSENETVPAFNDLLAKDLVLFVVLGDSPEAASLAESANRFAGLPEEHRWVFWAKNPGALQTTVAGLDLAEDVAAPDLSAPDRAFVLSFSNVICDVIRATDPPPRSSRIFKAYTNGEVHHD